MAGPRQHRTLIFGTRLCAATVALTLTIVVVLTVAGTQAAQAQTFSLIHTFTGGADGGSPDQGFTIDKAGNLYGSNHQGGPLGGGIFYKLRYSASGWTLTPLNPGGGANGFAFGPNGTLFATEPGQGSQDYGAVANLVPSFKPCTGVICYWIDTLVYGFLGYSDGSHPNPGIIFDQAGAIYGTTLANNGIVYKLTKSNGIWTKSTLYSFSGGSDGELPPWGVISDQIGNLYGTTSLGGAYGYGTVFQLVPSGSGWTENVLYSFTEQGKDGGFPEGALVFDGFGNLYGTAGSYGPDGNGVVFVLSPQAGRVNAGAWSYAVLYSFKGGLDGGGPGGNLLMGANGSLYGSTSKGGGGICYYGCGTIYSVSPGGAHTVLHRFAGDSDGAGPQALVLGKNGNLYGTTMSGTGKTANGVAFEITGIGASQP